MYISPARAQAHTFPQQIPQDSMSPCKRTAYIVCGVALLALSIWATIYLADPVVMARTVSAGTTSYFIAGLAFGYLLSAGFFAIPFISRGSRTGASQNPIFQAAQADVAATLQTPLGKAVMKASGVLYNNEVIGNWIEEHKDGFPDLPDYQVNKLYYDLLSHVTDFELDPKVLLGFSKQEQVTREGIDQKWRQINLYIHPDKIHQLLRKVDKNLASKEISEVVYACVQAAKDQLLEELSR